MHRREACVKHFREVRSRPIFLDRLVFISHLTWLSFWYSMYDMTG